MTRPPPRDQPSPAESAALLAELAEQVAAGAERADAQIVRSPERASHVRVRPLGTRTHLSLVEHGQVLADPHVDTADLIDILAGQGSPAFEVVTGLIAER